MDPNSHKPCAMSPSPSSNTLGLNYIQLQHSLTNHTQIHFAYYRYVDNRFITFNDTFLNHIGTQALINPDFFGDPVELEPVEDMHLLGFDVDLT